MTIHKTVLLDEAVRALNLKEGMTVVDATLGGGGHSRKILQAIGKKGKLIAFDRDKTAIERFEKSLTEKEKEKIVLVNDSFENIKGVLSSLEIEKVDAVLADLGISSDQLDDVQRGMSFQGEGILDMRMDQSQGLTAADIVNSYEEEKLIKIFKQYGDEKFAGKIAKAIVKARLQKQIKTTKELVEIILSAVPEKYKHQKIHPATKTFQALRIEVNQELKILEPFVYSAVDVLKSGGRLVIITFHSGEDVIIKNVFRENARGCICPPEFPVCRCGNLPKVSIAARKPVLPSETEVQENPRSRSAKMRVVEKM